MQSVMTFTDCEKCAPVYIEESVAHAAGCPEKSTCSLSSSPSRHPFILYKRRWLVLTSYCLLSISAGSSWLCFPAVSNILREYYSIGLLSVNLLSIIFGIAIVMFSLPFAILLEKFGLAITLKLAALVNVLGATIRYFGSNQEYGYWCLFFGNMLTAVSVAGFLFLPGKIALSWFGDDEIGKAIAICVAFDALGTGLGFLHATSFIKNDINVSVIGEGIDSFLLSQLIPAISVFLFVIIFVRRQPISPPNLMEMQYLKNMKEHKQSLKARKAITYNDIDLVSITDSYEYYTLKSSIIKLLRNYDFHLIIHMQGITASIEGIFEMLLNEMLIGMYTGMEESIGIVGFIAVLLGFASNIIVGLIVDKTGSSKKISFVIFFVTTLCCIAWSVMMEYIRNFTAKAFVFCILMSTSTSYYTIAFTHTAQVTAPIPPSATGVMLVLTSQVYDTITSFACTEILAFFGAPAVNFSVVVISFIALGLSLLVSKKKLVVHKTDIV